MKRDRANLTTVFSAAMLLTIAAAAFAADIAGVAGVDGPTFPAVPVNAPETVQVPAPVPQVLPWVGLRPATQPSAPGAQVARWFDDLAASDPQVRETARVALMGLSCDELGILRLLVEKNRPVTPSQSAVLCDIVMHVYLAGGDEDRYANIGFLGVMLDNLPMPVTVNAVDDVANSSDPSQVVTGVLIQETVPGFCGFRFLHSGDVVLGVYMRQKVADGPEAEQLQPTPIDTILRPLIQRTPPGEPLTLQVLRQGRVMKVSFPLDAAPRVAGLGRDEVTAYKNARLDAARRYWEFAFEPLLWQAEVSPRISMIPRTDWPACKGSRASNRRVST
jgi:hypothetical protein